MPAGQTSSSDTWETGTRAAACGGTTTVIDFVEPEGEEGLLEAFQSRRSLADSQAAIDFSLHMTLTAADQETLVQIPGVVAAGITSFKTYTTYEGFRLTDPEFLAACQAVQAAGGMVLVHAENDAIVKDRTRALLAAGEIGPSAHPRSRPGVAEAEAVSRVLALAESAGVRLYIVHVSTARGAEAVARARSHGQAAYGETCPQYLLLTAADYDRPGFEGAKYVCSPPLRTSDDQAVLWEALKKDELQSVGTDHCPFNYEGQKDLGAAQFTDIPGGLPGIQARLELLHTFGVRAGRMDLNRWVAVCSTAPARIFGLYPQKGSLLPGSDADIVLFDPSCRKTITAADLSENVDYSPYEGFEVEGAVVQTYVQGRLIAENGKFVGDGLTGRFLPRS
jgi:dihydropyrimidinase